ncbi:MAG: insulinase family protein [Bacteroidaceae bacterium]|nr:insulinase family protein [Bacteroidaceae bacterium]
MINVTRHTLPNGLRVLHHYDCNTRMTALNVLYDVGSKDDWSHRTGFAHLFEHLMFGGSVNIPDFDSPLQLTGGENNAWTSNDVTNYYTIAPTHNIETAFWLESDRMLQLAFTPQSLEVQRHVVIEEFKQRNLNQPYGDIYQLIRPLAYTTHPYRWPVIGRSIEEIEAATLDEVKEFFYAHYAPNNAILCVAGSISWEETLRLCEKWFAPIPRREIAPRNLPAEPKQTAPRRLSVERDVPLDAIVKVYHMCDRRNAQYHACDLLSDVLGTGASSRLYKELVQEQQLFNSIDASISGEIECGLLIINGKLNRGVSIEEGEAAINREIAKLQQEGVTEREINKVINRFEAEHLVSNLNYTDKAANLAYHELIGRAEDINTEVDKYKALTPQDIQNAAREVLQEDNCSTLYYHAVSK